MSSPPRRFEWLEARTECREARSTAHGEELRWLVSRETIRDTATGETLTRAIVRHPGIVVVVPFTGDDRILLVRQYRHAVDGELWELPAGTLAGRQAGTRVVPVETPEACAARELVEETGYAAAGLEKLGECYAMPGSSDEVIHVFAARGLAPGPPALDPGEVIDEVRAFGIPELQGMLRRGEIRDAKTLVGLLHALGRRPGGLRLY